MQRVAGIGFMLIGLLHMTLFGWDAWPQAAAVLSGALWTTDHTLLPVAARDPALLQAEHAFWSTIGSAGIPVLVLGLVILWIDRSGLRVPAAPSALLVIWSAVGTALMQPSGFPLVLLASALLLIASLRRQETTPGTD